MADMFATLGTWNWLIFGFILMALEVLAPGVFLFWLGLAALLVGLIYPAICLLHRSAKRWRGRKVSFNSLPSSVRP